MNNTTPRAQRFDMRVPVQYRSPGTGEWKVGASCNVSGSGVLFLADVPLEIGEGIEIVLAFEANAGLKPADLQCVGEVVRREMVNWPEIRPAIAAKFRHVRFAASKAGPGVKEA